MKKLAAGLLSGLLLLAPVSSARAHENPVVEKGIMDVVLFPFQVVLFIVSLPFKAVGELTHKHPHEEGEHSHEGKSGC